MIKSPSPSRYQAKMVNGVGSGQRFVTMRGSWLELPDLPQVLMDMEMGSKIEHRVVFCSL